MLEIVESILWGLQDVIRADIERAKPVEESEMSDYDSEVGENDNNSEEE